MNTFKQTVIRTYGDRGRKWLESLPTIVNQLTKQWKLTGLEPVENLSYNYVLRGYQDQTPIVLKVSCNAEELKDEALALSLYNGNKCVKLISYDFEYHALLLEQAIPGTTLVHYFPDNDDQALEQCIAIMRQLHATELPKNILLPSLKGWFQALFNPPAALDSFHVQKAQEIVSDLLMTQTSVVLLHGDLHHDNILLSERGYVAIDPKGLIGDPAFEPVSFIRNPFPGNLKDKKIIQHRIALFSEYLSLDKERIAGWLYAEAVLDACWAIEEGERDMDKVLVNAERIRDL